MAEYTYHLGFDWNVSLVNNERPLNIGRVLLSNGAAVADNLFHPLTATSDFVSFKGFNQTSGADLSGYSIVGGTLTFQAEESTQAASSPFNVTELHVSSIGPATSLEHSAALLGPEYPIWNPIVPLVQATTSGVFQFVVRLHVQGPNGLVRTFVADPEMIVGSVG